jgi:hypothetical protein
VLAFSLTVYGMAGLNRDPQAVAINAGLSLMMYLIATQVGWAGCSGCRLLALAGAEVTGRLGSSRAACCTLAARWQSARQ